MSTVMAADDLLKSFLVEETSCGPLCQHPQCWASNRRVERGLPRLKDPLKTSWNASDDEGALATLKVQNLLAESGLGRTDDVATRQQPKHHCSASAPAVDFNNRPKHKFPYTPYTSPLGVRLTSAQSGPSPTVQSHRPTKARSVEVRELFEVEELNSDWQQTFLPSRVYVWCPSKKAYERQLQRERHPTPELNEQNDASKLVTVKDMTDEMVLEAPKDKNKRTKKMKKKPSRITPTGGRPYTHPSRSPLVHHRQAKPVDIDESIAELLTLPRDILMDVLVHIKNSDNLDKQKVQLLLSRLMPLIHFDTNQPLHRSLSPTPLLASGILQNKKMSLLQGGARGNQGEAKGTAPGTMASGHHKHPFYLDDNLVSAMTTSTYSALAEQLPMEEGSGASEKEVGTSGRMARQQPLGPINAGVSQKTAPVAQSTQIRNKLTSVSTKSLPPLVPGSKPTKPFDYKADKTLDLTLGPLPTPDSLSPEKPSTPHSEKASTLYVTLPSVPSPDRTELTTSLQPYGRMSAPIYAERFASQYLHDTPSPIGSEDFHPLHAVSPSLSTGVPQAPLGTPATNIHQPYKPLSASHPRPGRLPSPSKQVTGNLQKETSAQDAEALGTIREVHSELTTTYQGTSAMDTSLPTSPMKHGMTPVSTPWGNCTSITAGGVSDAPSRSPAPPVTPQPSTASPEPWPIVDERDFMTSPEKPRETVPGQEISMATPMAPPPSPEPQELKGVFEYAVNDMSKSGMTSLTPLVEEGEEEEEEEPQEDWGDAVKDISKIDDLQENVGNAVKKEIKDVISETKHDSALETEDSQDNFENQMNQKEIFESKDVIEERNKVDEMDNIESEDLKKYVDEKSASKIEDVVNKATGNHANGALENENNNKDEECKIDQESTSEIKDIKLDLNSKIDHGDASLREDIRKDEGIEKFELGNKMQMKDTNQETGDDETTEDVAANDTAPNPARTPGNPLALSSVDDATVRLQMNDNSYPQVSVSAVPCETKLEHSDSEGKTKLKLPTYDIMLDVENTKLPSEPQECILEKSVPTENQTTDPVGQVEGQISNMDIN